ncbi:unnamed protein product, partial [Trichogramma brassicae]
TWPYLIGMIVARTRSKEESRRVAAKSLSCGSLTVAIHHGISGIELSDSHNGTRSDGCNTSIAWATQSSRDYCGFYKEVIFIAPRRLYEISMSPSRLADNKTKETYFRDVGNGSYVGLSLLPPDRAHLEFRSNLYTRRVSVHRPYRNAPSVFGKSARRHVYRAPAIRYTGKLYFFIWRSIVSRRNLYYIREEISSSGSSSGRGDSPQLLPCSVLTLLLLICRAANATLRKIFSSTRDPSSVSRARTSLNTQSACPRSDSQRERRRRAVHRPLAPVIQAPAAYLPRRQRQSRTTP